MQPGPSRVRWGLTLCAPKDQHVVRKLVCYNERSALHRGRAWKRRYPDHVVRAMSLLPRDTSPPEEIAFVRLAHR